MTGISKAYRQLLSKLKDVEQRLENAKAAEEDSRIEIQARKSQLASQREAFELEKLNWNTQKAIFEGVRYIYPSTFQDSSFKHDMISI